MNNLREWYNGFRAGFYTALIAIGTAFLLITFAFQKCNAQTPCATYLSHPAKGDTIIVPCDSLTLIATPYLRSAIAFERQKNAALVRLNIDKDRAVKELVKTYENQISNYKLQVETLEVAYRKAVDQHRETLYNLRIGTAKIEGTVDGLALQLKSANDARELERNAAKKLLWKRSLTFGGIGVGFGGILTTLIFVAR